MKKINKRVYKTYRRFLDFTNSLIDCCITFEVVQTCRYSPLTGEFTVIEYVVYWCD